MKLKTSFTIRSKINCLKKIKARFLQLLPICKHLSTTSNLYQPNKQLYSNCQIHQHIYSPAPISTESNKIHQNTALPASICTDENKSIVSYSTNECNTLPTNYNITFHQKIGEGHFSEIWRGTIENGKTEKQYAIKIMKQQFTEISLLINEAHNMKNLKHDRLLRFVGLYKYHNLMCLVTEFIRGKNLLNYLQGETCYGHMLDLKNIAIQILSGMCYIEKQLYVHRNLAANKILIDKNKFIKITDFTFASNKNKDSFCMISLRWAAPEVIIYSDFTNKSDVWSFGVVLYEIFSHGTLPYFKISTKLLLSFILKGYKIHKPNGCSNYLYKIMKSCWHLEARYRPTFNQLFNELSANEDNLQS